MKKLIITMIAIAFYGSTFSGDYSGDLNIEGETTTSLGMTRAIFTYTLTNTSSTWIEPILKLLILDCNYNTIKEETLVFDTIYPGKYQKQEDFWLKYEGGGARIKILSAKTRSGGFRLEGIDGRTWTFACATDKGEEN
tara:strand:+ start:2211 stop:2624 length:414 start_codon:yes stop_codon:yes gene_type:complete